MTTVCFVTDPADDPRDGLLSFETTRQALSPYDLSNLYANALAIETVSLGSAVALLDDLDWYLRRTVREVIVKEPSISDTEWLSRDLATGLRDESITPEDTTTVVKMYGIDDNTLVDPMYAERREDGTLPGYDLRDVDGTVIIRVSEDAFGG